MNNANNALQSLDIVFPEHTNTKGTAFGGWIVSIMDKAAGMAATRQAKGDTVTVRIDEITFKSPLRVGDAVRTSAVVVSTGNTSLKVAVEVHKHELASGEEILVASGNFVFVAIDENGKSRPVPPLEEA